MGTLKKIAVGVAILVIAAIIGLFVNAAWNDYAIVEYNLKGANYAVSNSNLDVNLYEGNSGDIGVVPTAEIVVINATITGVSLPDVARFELSNYCQYNDTEAIVSNFTTVKGLSLSNWATIHIIPNNGAPSFSVSVSVTLPTDWFHPKNALIAYLQVELDYNQTSANQYSLLQS